MQILYKLIITTLPLLHLHIATAAGTPMNPASYCNASDISKVDVPLNPQEQEAQTFALAYKRFAGTGNPETTVIVLPGGPGDTLLQHFPTESNYPYGAVSTDQFNIIYTEPRGLGCNQPAQGDFPESAFNMEFLANDIVAIIQKEKLTKYIIYGASFGTVHATYVAHLVERAGLPRPKAVVLEGTLGRGVPGRFAEYISGFTKEWNRVKFLIPPAMAALFSGSTLPLGYPSNVWGAFIFKQLIAGDVPHYGPWLQYQLLPLLTGDAAGLQALNAALVGYQTLLSYPANLRIPRIFQVLACRNLFGGWLPDVTLKGGMLIGAGQDICDASSYAPYDSSEMAIHSPIVYFQGPFDPATPMASAHYHFERQMQTNRIFVLVDGAAHAPLSNSLVTLGCNKRVWAQIDKNPLTLSGALADCGDWKIDVETRAPGE